MSHVSLQDVQVVDVHCHPYVANEEPYRPEEFVRKLSLAVIPFLPAPSSHSGRKPFPGTNMWMQILINRLARYFGCDPTVEEVVRQRNERAEDFRQYTRALFQDARISGLVVDFGYPVPMLDKKAYADLCGARIWEVYRIEPVMVRLRTETASFGEFLERFRADLRAALKREEVIGLKSIIAYRSGLQIGEKDEAAASEQWPLFQANERAEVKAIRDYCLHVALEECTEADKAMHIHTGIGDGDVVLPKASPGFLLSLLRDKKYVETKVHLVHGGYPWIEEAAFIVSVLPRVYLDVSLQNPFAGHGVRRILSQVFEFAPFDKVMYGSDAFTVPEMNWLGVHLFKECFERLLNEWVAADYMDAETARCIGEMVLYGNFQRVYQVS
ncbi:MAG: amidohydrolase family protein [Brevibacillus sp.]|nr:amidohydrolase family protein [Brevibacillus sp.]